MKKILLLSIIAICLSGIAYAIEQVKYSDKFIHRFSLCGAYSESTDSQISTGDRQMPTAHLKSTVSVVGIRNGKCAIRYNIYAKEMMKDILVINCAFTQEQHTSLLRKMKAAQQDETARQNLKQTMKNYIEKRPDVCTYRNYMNEDENND